MWTGDERESLVDNPIPDAGDEAFASFLNTVRGMVHGERPTAEETAGAGVAGADKATRRHEEKLAKAERRSARRGRRVKSPVVPDVAAAVEPDRQVSTSPPLREGQRVPV